MVILALMDRAKIVLISDFFKITLAFKSLVYRYQTFTLFYIIKKIIHNIMYFLDLVVY